MSKKEDNKLDVLNKNLNMIDHSNGERYLLKPHIIEQFAINYPEYIEDLKGEWIKYGKYDYQALTGKKKLMLELKSFEVEKIEK